MGMGFLTPLFFAGLAALIAPILVHLVRRQDPTGIRFPSLMFLQRIPFEERRRRKIRHWALLALRCLALVLLVLAFARPVFHNDDSGTVLAPGQRDIAILLDRSYSMGYADRWARAQAAALETIDNLTAGDRATVVLFDRQAHLSGALSADKAALRAIIERAQPGVEVTDFRAALDQAVLALADSVAPQREIVMISDFQRGGVDPADVLHLPAGINLNPQAITSGEAANVAVGFLNLERRRQDGRERIAVSAQIVNRGAQAVMDQRIVLEINGHEQEARELALAAGSSGNISFDLLAPREPARAVLRLAADGLPQDNAFYFILAPVPTLPVLVIENNTPRPHQSLFLGSALALGDAPAYRVDIKSVDELQITDFDEPVMIVINDAPLPGGALGVRLQQFVENGGGLLVVVGEYLQGGWPGGADGFLPGTLGNLSDSGSRAGAIGYLDYGHPLFQPFQTPGSGDFAATQVFRYRKLTAAAGDRVLASFDDGAAALIERRVGAGRAVALTTTLDTHWNNLAVQPVFVPFLHLLAKYLSGYEHAPAWFAVGDVVDLARYARASAGGETLAAALARGEEAVVQTPSGEVSRLGGEQALLIAAEHGVYEVHGTAGSGSETMVAVNLDPAESDLTSLDVPAFVADIETLAAATPSEPAKPSSVLRKLAEQQRLWWYVLIAAIIVFIAETVISNRLSRAPERRDANAPSGA